MAWAMEAVTQAVVEEVEEAAVEMVEAAEQPRNT